MKNYFNLIFSFFLFFSILFFSYSCSEDNPTKSKEKEIIFSAKQIKGCNNSLSKISEYDSCFTYNFEDTLKIDFCVFGNCCPDSNRFVTNYEIKNDTVFLNVADTAENNCKCMCNYIIHMELSNLSNNNYLFYCDFPSNYSYIKSLAYREEVIKH